MPTENKSLPVPKFHMPKPGGIAKTPLGFSGVVDDAQYGDSVQVMTSGGQHQMLLTDVILGVWRGESDKNLAPGRVSVTVRLKRGDEFSEWAQDLEITVS